MLLVFCIFPRTELLMHHVGVRCFYRA